MFVRRLEKLANHLEAIASQPKPERAFDLAAWFGRDPYTCGTRACAVGEACFIPEFKKAGLSLTEDTPFVVPTYKDSDSWGAVCAFFGIKMLQAIRLFNMTSYPDEARNDSERVAYRIRNTVKRYRARRR